jgi:hypothetical protein
MAWWDGISGAHWVTLEDGQHVLIDGAGRIQAGLGQQNVGKTFGEAFGGKCEGEAAQSSPSHTSILSSGLPTVVIDNEARQDAIEEKITKQDEELNRLKSATHAAEVFKIRKTPENEKAVRDTLRTAGYADKEIDGIVSNIYNSAIYNTGGDIGRKAETPQKDMQRIADRLASDLGDTSIDVYEFGEGSMRRQLIAMDRDTKNLSGGRKQHTIIDVQVNAPRKVMGQLHVGIQESSGFSAGKLTYNKSGGYSRNFNNYEELKAELSKLKSSNRNILSSF